MEIITQIWSTYKGEVIPALVTAIIAMIPFLFFWIKRRMEISNERAAAQLEALKKVSEKEDTTPQLEKLSAEIEALKTETCQLKENTYNSAELFNLAFQSSALSPEIKENLESIKNKIKVGSNTDVIENLQNQVSEKEQKLSELITEMTSLKESLVPVKEKTKDTIKKIRR